MDPLSIAGLALGAYPVLSHAFNQYKQGIEYCHKWRRFRTQFESFGRKVDAESYFFENVVRELMFGPPAPFPLRGKSEKEVLKCMEDQNDAIWQSMELKSTVSLRLGDRYDWFLATIQEIREIQEELYRLLQISEVISRSRAKELLLADPNQLKTDEYTAQWWEFQWKRIKETLWIERRYQKVEKLHALTDDLQRTLEIRNKQLDAGGSKSLSAFPKLVERAQQSACSLYSALIKAWGCSCTSAHTTLLRLDHCGSSCRTSIGEYTLFDVVFIVPVDHGIGYNQSGNRIASQKNEELPQIRQAVEVKVFDSQKEISRQPLQPVMQVKQQTPVLSGKKDTMQDLSTSPQRHSVRQYFKGRLPFRYV
jgi:hypothetical protein